MAEIIGSLIALLAASVHKNFPGDKHDYMWIQTSIAMGILSIPIAMYFAKRLGTLFGCFVVYVMIHSSSQILFYYGRYAKAPLSEINVVSIDTCFALLTLLIFTFGVTELTPRWVEGIKRAIPVYTLLNAFYVILVHLMGWKYGNSSGDQGFFDYSGMNATLMASCAGFLIPKEDDRTLTAMGKIFAWVPVLLALYFSHSAMGWGVLAVVLSARFRCLWILPFPLIVGYLVLGDKMLDSSFRFPAYKFFMGEFFHSQAAWFGTGLGTFKTHSNLMQTDMKFMLRPDGTPWIWLFLHSDILQAFFELGIIGGVMTLGLLGVSFLMALMSQDIELLSLLCGCLATSLLDYPCRYPVSAFLCLFSVVESLRLPLAHPRSRWAPRQSFSEHEEKGKRTDTHR